MQRKSDRLEGLIDITTIPLLPPTRAEIELTEFLCSLDNEILAMLVVVMYIGRDPYLKKNNNFDRIFSNRFWDFTKRDKWEKVDILKNKLSCLSDYLNEGVLRLDI